MKHYSKSTEEITLCDECNGRGIVHKRELEDLHRGEYKEWDEICKECKGGGRIKTVTRTTVETSPYNNSGISFLRLQETTDK